jgi:dTDP-4-amino-4,6-dideoxygalactose transaminase
MSASDPKAGLLVPKRIPLAEPDLRGREAEYLAACVRDNWVSSAGPQIAEFEKQMAALSGRSFAVATVNGTAALHLALIAAGVRTGDAVVVPDWTFAASVNAVVHAGARPHFIDVAAEDWGLDAALLDEVLASDRTVRAVIAVDPLGHAADFDAIEAVCRKHGVPLIEDAAGAIGAHYKGRACGSFGALSVFSFNGNKTVTAGGGGMLLTDDEDKARLARHLSTQARPGRDYVHDMVGYNYRMTNVNAAIGLAQLERLDEMLQAKRAIAARYDKTLAGRDDIRPMPRPGHSQSACWLYSCAVANERDAAGLVDAMDRASIDARIFWRSLSAQQPWRDAPRKLTGISQSLSGRVVSLPSSSSLSEGDQARVTAALNMWRGRAAA